MKPLVITVLLLTACRGEQREAPPVSQEPTGELNVPNSIARDLAEITADGMLHVALPTDSTSYFLYRNQPMGFELDLLQAFADSRELELSVTVIHGREDRLVALADGRVDIVGGRLSHDVNIPPTITFGEPLFESQPTTVQVDPAQALAPADMEAVYLDTVESLELNVEAVSSPADLAGREVWLQRDSQWVPTVAELEDEYGDITVVGVDPDVSTETLIRWVATGRVNLTVASSDLAQLKTSYYQNLVVVPTLGPKTEFGFATRTPSTELTTALNTWVTSNTTVIEGLHRQYFVDRTGYRERIDANPLSGPVDKVSQYDDLFRAFSPQIGWDWRLLAAQAYQESAFDASAKSWAGAQGLLQLMPATAKEVGVEDPWDASENTRGAVKYLVWLDDQIKTEIHDPAERVKFILASYNAGLGHVQDAQRLAEANGNDRTKWADVAYWMLQLSRSEVYTHDVVKYGFCRGLEPVLYVKRITDRFRHYEQLVAE